MPTTSNSKQESSKINSLIKQFGEVKILLAVAIIKLDRSEQSKTDCKTSTYTTPNCNQTCNVCQRCLIIHIFWKCLNYNITSNRSNSSILVTNTTNLSNVDRGVMELGV